MKTPFLMIFGNLEVSGGSESVTISYTGNMGATIADVKEEFEKNYGYGTFEVLRKEKLEAETGSPDYLYSLHVSRDVFDLVTTSRKYQDHELRKMINDRIQDFLDNDLQSWSYWDGEEIDTKDMERIRELIKHRAY